MGWGRSSSTTKTEPVIVSKKDVEEIKKAFQNNTDESKEKRNLTIEARAGNGLWMIFRH